VSVTCNVESGEDVRLIALTAIIRSRCKLALVLGQPSSGWLTRELEGTDGQTARGPLQYAVAHVSTEGDQMEANDIDRDYGGIWCRA
jgi:hypothetical protein